MTPDFLVWHCAGCGAAARGTKKPCDCATNVGIRKGPNGKTETTWWDDPPDESDAEIAQLRALAAKVGPLREALRKFSIRRTTNHVVHCMQCRRHWFG